MILDSLTAARCAEEAERLAEDKARLTETVALRYRAYQGDPDNVAYCSYLGRDLAQSGRVEEGLAFLKRACELAPDDRWVLSNYLWYLHYLPHLSSSLAAQGYRELAQRFMPADTPSVEQSVRPDPAKRLRIAYLSPDFYGHSTAGTFEPVLDGHDRAVVELFGYGNVAHPDEVTRRFRQKFDTYRSVRGQEPTAVAQRIADDQIDILVALGGHCADNCLQVLAYRPAPIQVDYGAINTTGLVQIDYRLTDLTLDPERWHADYVEESICLPDGATSYRPPRHSPLVSALPARENGFVTFGSFNNNMKINSFVISLWAQILKACPGTHLLLRFMAADDPRVRDYYVKQFAQQGVSSDRLTFYGSLSHFQLLQVMEQVDIGLDAYPYNGCITTLESLWMGVPMVTLSGPWNVSRMGRSLLTRLGLEIFAASDAQEYVVKACAFAGQLDELAELRPNLRPLMVKSPLCDPKRLARQLEAAYQEMWRRWCRGRGVTVDSVPVSSECAVEPVTEPQTSPSPLPSTGPPEPKADPPADTAPDLATCIAQAERCSRDMARQTETIAWGEKALRLDPENREVRKWIAIARLWTGQTEGALQDLESLILDQAQRIALEPMLLWWKHYLPHQPAELAERYRRWAALAFPASQTSRPFANSPIVDRRLRIGYLSGDFRAHSVAYTFQAAFAAHDRAQVEVYGYGSVKRPDAVTEEIARHCDVYHSVYALSDSELEQTIRKDRIDLLVTMGGHTAHNRLAVCARRPAPILVDYGSIDTLGMSQIAYRLTDAILDPDTLSGHYMEQCMRLPGGLACFSPPLDAPLVGTLPAARRGYCTFGSFNNNAKMSPQMITLWAEILKGCPESRLVLKFQAGLDPGAKSFYLAQFDRQGVASQRIDIHGHFPSQFDHLKLYSQVDIALDTFPYNGCVTTLQGLWMGVPVVSLTGQTFVSKLGATLLSRLGLEDWMTQDSQAYVSKALAHAKDTEGLAALRRTLRRRMMRSVLCDATRFARELESAYRQMWRSWCLSAGT